MVGKGVEETIAATHSHVSCRVGSAATPGQMMDEFLDEATHATIPDRSNAAAQLCPKRRRKWP